MELGNQIRENRATHGLTQEELAERVFVTRQTVSNWETGKSCPDIQSLLMLSDLFGVTLDQLVKGDIETMKNQVNREDVRKFNRDRTLFSILLLAVIASALPLANALKAWGVALWALLAGLMLYFGWRVEKTKRENDIYTYREILAFLNGEPLDELTKAREKKKRRSQRILLALLSVVTGAGIALLLGVLMGLR